MGAASRRHGGDRGAALILVLVLIVIAGLMIVPMARYATSVLRANQVVSTRRAQSEAAKAGFRYSMSDPQHLYDACRDEVAGPNAPADLPEPPGLAISTRTTCYQLDERPALETEDIPESLATTYAGQLPPFPAGTYYAGSGDADPSRWINDSSPTQTAGTVFLPDLPVHALTLRAAAGFQMPDDPATPSVDHCRVYFPGTYKSELVINEPTYFTSGVYYFEKAIRLVGGADVVAGSGTYEGCTTDQEAIYYAINAPNTHNSTPIGATFVLGDEGRIVVDDSTGAVSFKMNQRYVATADHGGAPSARVSIMTVNGDLDPALETSDYAHSGRTLELPGAPDQPMLRVPLSFVPCQPNTSGVRDCADDEDDASGKRPATKDSYKPSTLVPEPHPPSKPGTPTNGAAGNRVFNGAVLLKWAPPANDGGKPITQYTVSTSTGTTVCTTTGRPSCLATGLTNGTSYRFVVTATNSVGTSPNSDPMPTGIAPASALTAQPPAAPTNVHVAEATPAVSGQSKFDDTFVVSWTAPVNDATTASTSNAAPVDSYTVLITDLDTSIVSECTAVGETTCVFQNLPLPNPAQTPTPYLARYRVDVTASNVTGVATTGTSPVASVAQVNLPVSGGEEYIAPADPLHPPYTPPPVVDVTMTSNNPVTFIVPGYVSTPQGVVRVDLAAGVNAGNKQVRLDGGVLAAWMLLGDDNQPSIFAMGLENPTVQRVIRIETTVDGGTITSTGIVQINESGGWAVNSWVVQ